MESSKLADRKAILETYERYTREEPAEVGQAMRDAVSSILVFPSSAILPREVPIPLGGPAAPSVAESSYPWGLGWAARGQYFDKILPSSLPPGFRVIDDF